jgi:hypothetical protein
MFLYIINMSTEKIGDITIEKKLLIKDMTKEQKRVYYKNYYQKNKEKINARTKEYRQEWFQEYYKINKEAYILKSRERYHGEKHAIIKEKNRLYNQKKSEKLKLLETRFKELDQSIKV